MRSFFDRAQETDGTVEEVFSDGKRAAIHYEYVFRGREYHGKYELWHRQSMFFSEGQTVTVLFDRSKPERAYLKQQFT